MSTEPNTGPPQPSGPDPIIGKEIDGCTIVKKIGQGGMGIVYLAEHSKLRQQYVVKILNPALTAAEDTVQRFFREAQSVARLNHPSIVGIQNVGQEGEYYYIRMEYVDGDTVENIVKEKKKLDWKLATNIILETAEALSHAHKKGTIHRDIKPENIMLTKNGEVKVMDFGLAKQVQAATKVSVTGQIVGTPFFMSPEQAGGKTVDARSDIYSLGVSYYYLLTGVKPFNGKNLQEIFLKHFFYTPESPKIYAPDLPENVCEVIRRCLKKKKKERYQSAAQLAKDLRAVVEGGELSAPEASDSTESVPTAPSSPDVSMRPVDGNVTARGGFAASSSDPSIQTGDMVSRDLAAAQAEIGAGEPGTIVAQGKGPDGGNNGSATVIAKALATSEEAAPAAPLTKRGGRVSLTTQSGGASLVFQPGKAPFQPGGGTATAPAPDAPTDSSVGDPSMAPDMGQKPAAGNPTSTIGATKTEPRKPPAPPQTKKILVAVIVVIALLGAYQLVGMIQFSSLESNYARVQAIHPDPNKTEEWAALKKELDDLADGYDKFAGMFKLTPSGAEAVARAEKCRESAKTAETERTNAEKRNKDSEEAKKLADFIAKNRKEAQEKLGKLIDQIKALIAQKKYDEAVKTAPEAFNLAKGLNERLADVKCPVEVTCDLAAKAYNAGTNEELGVVSPNTPAIVVVPFNDPNFKLEVRKPKFKPFALSGPFLSFKKIPVQLDREIKSRFALGKREIPLFKGKANVTLFAAAPMSIDTQAPQSIDVVCQDGTLRSYEVNGRTRWPEKTIPQIGEFGDRIPGPEVLPGKAIVTATPDGVVTAHDVPTGAVVAQARLASPIVATPRIDPTATLVVAGTLGGEIVCLDVQNANAKVAPVKWRLSTEASVLTQPLIQGNQVMVGSLDDRMRVIDLQTGKLEAYYDAREAICAGPIAAGAFIYLGTREGRVHAITIANGAVKPEFTTGAAGSEILQLMASAKGVFYSTKNDVRSTDATGTPIFQPFTPTVEGIPYEVTGFVPMNDSIAIVTLGGWVFSIDAKTGRENWKVDLKTSIRVPPVFDGDLHIATMDGEIITIAGD